MEENNKKFDIAFGAFVIVFILIIGLTMFAGMVNTGSIYHVTCTSADKEVTAIDGLFYKDMSKIGYYKLDNFDRVSLPHGDFSCSEEEIK